MFLRTLPIAVLLLALTGCATQSSGARGAAGESWPDQAFQYDRTLVTVGRDDLFRLDPELARQLDDPAVRGQAASQRLKHLLALIFGRDYRGFGYTAGRSTTAADTWKRKEGDCLSLTVLTYSVARALGMPAQMQEVQVPALFDRRGGLDVVNQHVNVLFARAQRNVLEDPQPRDIVVDFEPDFATGQRGKPLTEEAVLARFYNNIAVEHLARDNRPLAYAHFKAAILADPTYSAAHGNLAVLYRRAGMEADAERLLRQAVALGDSADVALRALHQLLTDQGRTAEARQYARMLDERRANDPYYWISTGLANLQEGDARGAIRAFERARAIASGFPEVHRHLAVAYALAGEPRRAQEELAMLTAAGGDPKGLSKLRGKVKGLQPQIQRE